MNIYVVRHGETDWNNENKLQGNTDIELNDNGRKQAFNLAEELRNINYDIIISSPLKRAIQTANIINNNKPIIIEDNLKERDFGDFEGKILPDLDNYWDYNKNLNSYKVENIKDFFNRVFNVVDKIINTYKEKNVLIVAHACVMIGINCYFNGLKKDFNYKDYCFENCKYVKYSL